MKETTTDNGRPINHDLAAELGDAAEKVQKIFEEIQARTWITEVRLQSYHPKKHGAADMDKVRSMMDGVDDLPPVLLISTLTDGLDAVTGFHRWMAHFARGRERIRAAIIEETPWMVFRKALKGYYGKCREAGVEPDRRYYAELIAWLEGPEVRKQFRKSE